MFRGGVDYDRRTYRKKYLPNRISFERKVDTVQSDLPSDPRLTLFKILLVTLRLHQSEV